MTWLQLMLWVKNIIQKKTLSIVTVPHCFSSWKDPQKDDDLSSVCDICPPWKMFRLSNTSVSVYRHCHRLCPKCPNQSWCIQGWLALADVVWQRVALGCFCPQLTLAQMTLKCVLVWIIFNLSGIAFERRLSPTSWFKTSGSLLNVSHYSPTVFPLQQMYINYFIKETKERLRDNQIHFLLPHAFNQLFMIYTCLLIIYPKNFSDS